MKKFVTLLLILGLCSVASAGTMVITGLPAGDVDTSGGPVVLSFDVVSNGQLDNDTMYVYATTGGTLDILSAINNVVPGVIYDDDPLNYDLLGDIVDTTNVSHPVVWAEIAIVRDTPRVIVGDILSDLGLTVPMGFEGWVYVSALSENSGAVQDMVGVHYVPEPVTIALLGLGGLFLRRRK